MSVLPQEVKEIIEFAELATEHKERVIITHRTYANHILVLLTVIEQIKKEILVSGNVELVDYGSLPRSERKSKRVFDNRDND